MEKGEVNRIFFKILLITCFTFELAGHAFLLRVDLANKDGCQGCLSIFLEIGYFAIFDM